MWTRDLQLLIDLEIIDPRMRPDEAFFVWAKLNDDPVIAAAYRAFDYRDPRFRTDAHWPVHETVAAMNPKEKIALAERVRTAYAESQQKSAVA